MAPAESQSNARVYMFEASGFVLYVVGGACGFNVLVVGAPVEYQMPLGSYVAGVGVVGGFVAGERECLEVDVDVAVQLVNRTVLLLLIGAYLHRPG